MANMRSILRILLFSLLVHFTLISGPTERHLEVNPIENIVQNLNFRVPKKKLNHLLEISQKETEETFFGYHGMTQNNRLFQDLLRAVFEEILLIELPENFYFMRIPGDPQWDWVNGKNSFLQRFGNRVMPEPYKKLILQNFSLLIEKEAQIKLEIEKFSKHDQEMVWSYFQSFIDYSVKNEWNNKAKKYSLPIDYPLQDPIFNEKLPILADLLEKKVAKLEDEPKKDAKAFRGWLEQKLSDDYNVHTLFFLRELQVDLEICKEIDSFFNPFDDTSQPQQSMLVALNVPLFGNYRVPGCFTPKIVLQNESVLGGDQKLQELLATFFEQIGLDSSFVPVVWKVGEKILKETENSQGCLLQFYDESALFSLPPHSFVDQNAFVSFVHALPVQDLVPSKYIQGLYSLTKKKGDLELRMVMNNQTTLNPFSFLRMIRYDGSSQEDSDRIIKRMKNQLKNCPRDEFKLQKYRNLLHSKWNGFGK